MSILKNAFVNLYEGLVDMIPSFNPILESIVKNIIQNQLGKYIDFKQFQLKSFKDVKLTNVNLKKEEINAKLLSTAPFLITYGQIGRMSFRIPLQDLLSKASHVEMSEIEIHLRPNLANISHESFEKSFFDLLSQATSAAESEQNGDQSAASQSSDYDRDKMNELKQLLLHVLLNIKAKLSDVVIKIFLQAEPTATEQNTSDPHLMLRISEISKESDKNQQSSNISGLSGNSSGVMFDKSFLNASGMNINTTQDDINSGGNLRNGSRSNLDSSSYFDYNPNCSDVTFKISGINVFLLPNSIPLSPNEFSHQGLKPQEERMLENVVFPFRYPHSKHPCNLLHVPEISTVLIYPLTNNLADGINITAEVKAIEIMLEPYQISLITDAMNVIDNWKKQIDCLKLLRFTKDSRVRQVIIDTNTKYVNSYNNNISYANLNQSQNPIQLSRQMNGRFDEPMNNLVDDFLFESLAEYKPAFLKRQQKGIKPSSNTNNSHNYQKVESFFNASILVDHSKQSMNAFSNQRMQQQAQHYQALDQSAYLNQSQLGKIISHDFKDRYNGKSKHDAQGNNGANSSDQSQQQSSASGSRSVSFRVDVKTLLVYATKGSVAMHKDGWNSGVVAEYSREWKCLQSRKEKINRYIACSYFQVKLSGLNLMMNMADGVGNLKVNLKSLKVFDVSLMDGKQTHVKCPLFNVSSKRDNHSSDQSGSAAELPYEVSSTFWRRGDKSDGQVVLQKFELSRDAHYCVSQLVAYTASQSNRKKTAKPSVDQIRMNQMRHNFGRGKEDTTMGQAAQSWQVYGSEESLYEKNVRLFDSSGYSSVKPNAAAAVVAMMQINGGKEGVVGGVGMGVGEGKNKMKKESQNKKPLLAVIFGQQAKEVKVNIQKIQVNVSTSVLLDVALITEPIAKWAEFKDHLNKKSEGRRVRPFDVPEEIRKIIKSIEVSEKSKNPVVVSLAVGSASVNILPYRFEEFFQMKEAVRYVYWNYVQWGCLCEAGSGDGITASAVDRAARGWHHKDYLNLTVSELSVAMLLNGSNNQVIVEFQDAELHLAEHATFAAKKVLRIGRNFIMQAKEGKATEMVLVYPMVSVSKREKQSEKKQAKDQQKKHLVINEERLFRESSDKRSSGDGQQPSAKVLPEDSFFRVGEQEPNVAATKNNIRISLPLIELYLTAGDLERISECAFTLKAMMDVTDQYKNTVQKVSRYFQNAADVIEVNPLNLLFDIQLDELNLYFNGNVGSQQQPSSLPSTASSSCLVLHLKRSYISVVLNKEMKKDKHVRNAKLTLRLQVDVDELLVLDNTLPVFIGKIGNQSGVAGNSGQLPQQQQSIHEKMPKIIEGTFPGNIAQFRVQSIFLPRLRQANVILYKANLREQQKQPADSQATQQKIGLQSSLTNAMPGSQHYHLLANGLYSCPEQRQLRLELIMRKKEQWNAGLAMSQSYSMSIIPESKCTVGRLKDQIEIKNLTLSHSVLAASAVLASAQVILLAESGLSFLRQMPTAGGDQIPKNAFKEMMVNWNSEVSLLNEFIIDYFPTPSLAFFSSETENNASSDAQKAEGNKKTLLSLEMLNQMSSLQIESIEDRFMSAFRFVIHIDTMTLSFQKKEQLTWDNNDLNRPTYSIVPHLLAVDIKVDRVSADFLHTKEFNGAIDNLMLDFSQHTTIDQLISVLGFSRVGSVFDIGVNLNKQPLVGMEINRINVHHVQVSLHSDVMHALALFVNYASMHVTIAKSSYPLQQAQARLAAMKIKLKTAEDSIRAAICEHQLKPDQHLKEFHRYYEKKGSRSLHLQEKQQQQSSSNVQIQFDIRESNSKQSSQQPGARKEPALGKKKSLESSQKSMNDDSFEMIDGDNEYIDIDAFTVNSNMRVIVDSICLYLYDGSDLEYSSIHHLYNFHEEIIPVVEQLQQYSQKTQLNAIAEDDEEEGFQVLEEYFDEIGDVKPQGSRLRQQNESGQNVKLLDCSVFDFHTLPSDEWPANELPAVIVREKNSKKNIAIVNNNNNKTTGTLKTTTQVTSFVSRDKVKKGVSVEAQTVLRIKNLQLKVKGFAANESDVKSHIEFDIEDVSASNPSQNYAQVSTQQAKEKDNSQSSKPFLNVKLFVAEVSTIRNGVSFLHRSIRQVNLDIHQVVNVNLSSLDAEFFLRFLSKPKVASSSSEQTLAGQPTQMRESFLRLMKKNSKLYNTLRLNQNLLVTAEQQQQQQDNSENNGRIETMTSIDFLFIPKISLFISNRKEGIDFSRLSKKEGLLQIINIGEIEGVELVLVPITIEDKNVHVVSSMIVQMWTTELKKNLKWTIASQLPLLKNILNIGHGIFNLVYMPLSYYQQGLSIIDGTYQGVKSFVVNTTSESMNLSGALISSIGSLFIKNAKNCSAAITQAKNYFSDQNHE